MRGFHWVLFFRTKSTKKLNLCVQLNCAIHWLCFLLLTDYYISLFGIPNVRAQISSLFHLYSSRGYRFRCLHTQAHHSVCSAGYSQGATLVTLAAEITDAFCAAFAIGPTLDVEVCPGCWVSRARSRSPRRHSATNVHWAKPCGVPVDTRCFLVDLIIYFLSLQ